VPLRLGQLWTARELIAFFALRDLRVRYKQAFFGVAWAVLQPLIGALAFTILFNRIVGVGVDGDSYFAFALLGYGVWGYVTGAVQNGAGSLMNNADLITKVSFPLIVAPAATWLPPLVDLAVAVAIATVVAAVAGAWVSLATVVYLPLGLVLLLLAVVAPTTYFSATVVKYRDVLALVGFGLQFLLFVTPIAYPPSLVPAEWRLWLYVNPVAGAVGALRAALVGTAAPSAGELALSAAVAVVLAFVGLVRFRRGEREFADIV
jgi:ABC-type polysaccharide/polyol phosphate export permease